MKIRCGDCVTVNLKHPVFKEVIVSRKSRTIFAIGEGFYMKFFFYAKGSNDTYYGDFIELVSAREVENKLLEEVVQ